MYFFPKLSFAYVELGFPAKRSGDYYMFEEESSDDEFLELEPPKESLAPEVSPSTNLRGVGPIQVLFWPKFID